MRESKSASRTAAANHASRPFFSQVSSGSRAATPFFQAKLEIGRPGDRFEREADSVADQIASGGDAPAVQPMCDACSQEDEESEQGQSQEDLVQTQGEGAQEEKELLQTKSDSTPAPVPDLQRRLDSAQGGGRPLPAQVSTEMGAAFGRNFGGVRVHTDPRAASISRDLGAQAFTHGGDIYFNQNRFAPYSPQGKHLLAHELAHVVQQGAASADGSRREEAPSLQRAPEAPAAATADPLTAPLKDEEWEDVREWSFRGEIGLSRFGADPQQNALMLAESIFCSRLRDVDSSSEDPLLCVVPDVTQADPRVQGLAQEVASRGPIQAEPLTAPLTDEEWRRVDLWLGRGEIVTPSGAGGVPLTGDPDRNALLIAESVFCSRYLQTMSFMNPGEDPILCLIDGVAQGDPRVQWLAVRRVNERGPIINWSAVGREERIRHVMRLLVEVYGFPENGAAGLVGNLISESGVLPTKIERAGRRIPEAGPLTQRDFAGRETHFTPEDVMNRSRARRVGPKKPGIGLAQWTSGPRRRGLFEHSFRGRQLGASILFDMDAQVDYLVTELQTRYAGVGATLMRSEVSLSDASDAVLRRFETPKSVLDGAGKLRPIGDPAIQGVLRRRRDNAQRALRIYNQEDEQ